MTGPGRIAALFTLILFLAAPAPARAELSAADQAAIRVIIAAQIEAFRRDDGRAAFGYATAGIRAIFGDPDTFMAMVKGGYYPLYRPQNFDFGDLAELAGGMTAAQKLFVTGPDGRAYMALYSLARQPDGTWQIDGCQMIQITGA